MKKSNADRMENLLRRYTVAPSGCWEWTGTKNGHGYGLICVGAWYSGKITTVAAHRLRWECTNGRRAGDLVVMHKCDNRGCINPDHLQIGTAADNNRDAMTKGRADTSGLRNVSEARERESALAYRATSEPPPVLSDWQREEWLKRYGKAA